MLQAKATPPNSAAVSQNRSCAWKATSGNKSVSEMQRNTPAANARQPPTSIWPPPESSISPRADSIAATGHSAANARFVRPIATGDQPPAAISDVIDRASSGLCRHTARKVPKPHRCQAEALRASATTAAPSATPSIKVCSDSPSARPAQLKRCAPAAASCGPPSAAKHAACAEPDDAAEDGSWTCPAARVPCAAPASCGIPSSSVTAPCSCACTWNSRISRNIANRPPSIHRATPSLVGSSAWACGNRCSRATPSISPPTKLIRHCICRWDSATRCGSLPPTSDAANTHMQ